MHREDVLSLLQARYPDRNIRSGSESWQTALVPAADPRVGDVIVQVDDEEFTVFVGPHTHTHFMFDDEIADRALRTQEAVDRLLAFLDQLFADQLVVWSVLGLAGGFYPVRGARPRPGILVRRFTWSGPVA